MKRQKISGIYADAAAFSNQHHHTAQFFTQQRS